MIYLWITSCVWGISFALSKFALTGLSPFFLSTLRLSIGALFVSLIDWRSFKQGPNRNSLLAGLFQIGIMYPLYIWSLKFIPSSMVGVLTMTTPLFTFLIAWWWGVDRTQRKDFYACLIAVLGTFICIFFGSGNGAVLLGYFSESYSSDFLWGLGLITLSNISFAVGNVMIRGKQEGIRLPWVFWSGAFVSGLVLLCSRESLPVEWPGQKVIWSVLYLSVIPTGFGFYFWNKGVKKVPANVAGILSNLKGPLSIFFGYLILSEQVNPGLVIGSVVLLFAASRLSSRSEQ